MLQVIGWLGCFYLVIKAIEFIVMAKPNAVNKEWDKWPMAGALAAFIGAFLFMIMINAQANSASGGLGLSSMSSPYNSSATLDPYQGREDEILEMGAQVGSIAAEAEAAAEAVEREIMTAPAEPEAGGDD